MKNDKIKVGIVFDDSLDRPDGVQQYVKTLGRWLMAEGHTVHYLVGQSDPKLNPDLTIHSLAKNFSVKGNQNTLSLPMPAKKSKIRELLERERYDVLHVQMPYNPVMSGRVIMSAPENTRIVGTFHIVGATWLENSGARALGILQRRTLKRLDAVVGVSRAAFEYARDYFGLDTGIIPNGVDTARFKKGKKLKKFDDGVENIIFLNRLVERKGCEYLIDAIHWMDNRGLFENRRAIICGKGHLRESLELKAKQYGLYEKVIFEGFIAEKDKADYLASADLAVYPSTGGESFGIVLVEAMASGVLTLGGDNVGYSTILGTQKELIIDPLDTEAFGKRIDKLLSNKKLRTRLLEWQQKELIRYDVNTVGRQIVDLYRG